MRTMFGRRFKAVPPSLPSGWSPSILTASTPTLHCTKSHWRNRPDGHRLDITQSLVRSTDFLWSTGPVTVRDRRRCRVNSVSGVLKASFAIFSLLLGTLAVTTFGTGTAGATMPVISAFTPTSGPDGTAVQVTGSSFPGPYSGSCVAEFANAVTTSACHIISATRATLTVASGAGSGPIQMSQGSTWTATSSVTFAV